MFIQKGELPQEKSWFLYIVGVCIILECIFTDVLLYSWRFPCMCLYSLPRWKGWDFENRFSFCSNDFLIFWFLKKFYFDFFFFSGGGGGFLQGIVGVGYHKAGDWIFACTGIIRVHGNWYVCMYCDILEATSLVLAILVMLALWWHVKGTFIDRHALRSSHSRTGRTTVCLYITVLVFCTNVILSSESCPPYCW